MPDIVLTYTDAARAVRKEVERVLRHKPAVEQVPLLAAFHRVLAEPILADRDQPPFPRSTRDGFACRAADIDGAKPLQIVGQLKAGDVWKGVPLAAGEAIEIMTGAPVPTGADCVVMVEHIKTNEDTLLVDSDRIVEPGENIVPAGAEAKSGSVIVSAGTRLAASHIAAAAACGYAIVPVYVRPRVAILATGDELVPVDHTPLTHQIRNSNSYSLAAQTKLTGAQPVILPVATDDKPEIESAIRSASGCDLLLLSGGVSMGKYDFVEQALMSLGAEFLFTGAKIQPGRPVVFGKLPQQYFFGLPGNPVSTMVTFLLFPQPLIAAFSGETHPGLRFMLARLAHDHRVKPGLTRFLPARVDFNIAAPQAAIISWQGSGDLASTAGANGFVVIPSDAEKLAAGDCVSVLLV
ncbi:gephyrin-like molybdotransferase Glp [Alloacidobacterium sp.]|uniref:molybdopterin molybdotransferase MoeA n=1 Tax=Alloacidobacterium sp. TaxID=2951999 RepID=UPI002D593365|nr:gephyrin-like molybdotransferase Glp [Alloacidobacterium sp.]HYK36975.1 gephyrin-like molybdotransferase Glp [Alloacidobacterium sp.]